MRGESVETAETHRARGMSEMANPHRPDLVHAGPEAAAPQATKRVPTASRGQTVAEVLGALPGVEYDTAAVVVVLDGGRLEGVVSIESLFAAPGDRTLGELMDPEPPTVGPGVDQEIAAWRAVRRGESVLTVSGEEGDYRGVIPADRLLEILLTEHDEDLTRLGGLLKDTASARSASLEPVPRRFRHRLPWLVLGLAGALLAAGFVARFEDALQRTVMLAFFMPGIVYLADAVGTQTETVVVRGLSVGVSIRRMVVRELAAGLAVGVALAIIAWPLILVLWGERVVATVVALALFAACSTATVAAMALPWAFNRFGRDPAFGSGPLATVVQDLLSIVIYFSIASVLS